MATSAPAPPTEPIEPAEPAAPTRPEPLVDALDTRQVLRTMSVGRVAVGSAMALLPGLAGRRWLGDAARSPATKVAVRAFGTRDALVGLGTLKALEEGQPVRPWALAGVAADATDAVATLLAFRHLPRGGRWLALLVAGGATAAGLAIADHLD